MPDYLMRDGAPLTTEEWEKLDQLVVDAASTLLVGRRVISLTGPFGPGLQSIPVDGLEVGEACAHDEGCRGNDDCDCQAVHVSRRENLTLPVIHKDFTLRWRDIQTSRQFGLPLDLAAAAAASAACGRAEDKMVFEELVEKADTKIQAGDWEEEGSGFSTIVKATEALVSGGFYGPYAAVLPPMLYANLHRLMGRGGRLEIEHIGKVVTGGVFQAPGLESALVIAQGVQNLDLVVGQDLATAYLGPDPIDHRFRVLESLALRVRRPGAICLIG
jgi:uncharacterized linocin/CFP29 family protein